MRIAVCDDETQIRNHIEKNIRLLYKDAEILQFADGSSLLTYDGAIDILFLDIQMQPVDGIEVARKLRKADKDVTIIFITAMEEYVFEAFDVRAFHYLVKPIVLPKFFEVLKRAVEDRKRLQSSARQDSSIAIKKGSVTQRVFLSRIIYIEVFNRIIIVHTIDEDIEFYGKMVELEQSLGKDFVRCHRSFIVNLRYVAKYDAKRITLDNGESVLLAKQKYKDFVTRYMHYLVRNRKTETKG